MSDLVGRVAKEIASRVATSPTIYWRAYEGVARAALRVSGHAELVETLRELAIASGKLIIATDEMEALRPQRQAALDALSQAKAVLAKAGGVS